LGVGQDPWGVDSPRQRPRFFIPPLERIRTHWHFVLAIAKSRRWAYNQIKRKSKTLRGLTTDGFCSQGAGAGTPDNREYGITARSGQELERAFVFDESVVITDKV
jgi:hypothetical protein